MYLMKNNFWHNEIDKKIMKIAWPTIVEQVLIMMVGIVSTILVSRLGKESLAAVGMVNYIVNFIQTIFTGLSTGCMIVVARVLGESDVKHVNNVLIQSLIIGVIVSIIIFIPNFIFSNSIIKLFYSSVESEVLEIAAVYYKLIFIGMPFVIVEMIVSGSLRGIGDTKTPLYITTIVNIINFMLSAILIYGVHLFNFINIDGLGVKGAAIASTTARIIGAALILYVLYNKKAKIHLSMSDHYKFNVGIVKRIIKVGVPSFLENLIMQGGFLLVQIVISGIGTAQIAAYQVGGNIHGLAIMPVLGIATTATALVGQNLGAEDYDEADTYAKESRKLSLSIAIVLGLLEFIFARQVAYLFSSDPEVIEYSCIVIRGFALLEPFMGIERVSASVLRTAGDLIYVIVTSVVALWLFRIVTVIIISKIFSLTLEIVMLGAFLDYAIRAGMYIVRMRTGKWKTLKV